MEIESAPEERPTVNAPENAPYKRM